MANASRLDALAAAAPLGPKEVGDQRAFLASGPPTASIDLCWRREEDARGR